MTKKYIGVIPPIITPVDEHENVDEKGFRKLISHCIENGIHGIFVAGSNGECLALTQAERDRAIKIAIDETAGRVPVMAGVMDSSTRRVIEMLAAGLPYKDVADACGITASRVRNIERAWRREQMALRQGSLALD